MNYNLYKDDCLNILKNIKDNSIDLVIIDPPYNVETTGSGLYKQNKRKYIKEIDNFSNGFSESVLEELCRVMKKINIYIFCSQKQIISLLKYFVEGKNCNWNIISWHKTNPVPACSNKYLTDTEYILFFREKGVKVYGNYESKKTWYLTPLNVLDKKKYNHPTVKPLDIIENFVLNSSKEEDVILDCYMGSGTTGVAALKNNRKFIGIEINDSYFNTTTNRINNFINNI